jgi:hypothetical protein
VIEPSAAICTASPAGLIASEVSPEPSGGEVPRNCTYRALAMPAAISQSSESASVAAATVLRARPRLGLVATAAGLVAAPGDDAGDEHPNEQAAQNHSHAGYT